MALTPDEYMEEASSKLCIILLNEIWQDCPPFITFCRFRGMIYFSDDLGKSESFFLIMVSYIFLRENVVVKCNSSEINLGSIVLLFSPARVV